MLSCSVAAVELAEPELLLEIGCLGVALASTESAVRFVLEVDSSACGTAELMPMETATELALVVGSSSYDAVELVPTEAVVDRGFGLSCSAVAVELAEPELALEIGGLGVGFVSTETAAIFVLEVGSSAYGAAELVPMEIAAGFALKVDSSSCSVAVQLFSVRIVSSGGCFEPALVDIYEKTTARLRSAMCTDFNVVDKIGASGKRETLCISNMLLNRFVCCSL